MEILAPAKVNLTLQVLGQRPDGYHEVRTWMVPISLFDRLVVERRPSGFTLRCPGRPELEGDDNLCAVAYRAFRAIFGEATGLHVELHKEIPTAAGLGGGSSDAAAVLRSLAAMHDVPLDDPRLAEAALSVGSDVPFFLRCEPALASGRGEILEPAPTLSFSPSLVLIHPPIPVSAGAAYRGLALEGRGLRSPRPLAPHFDSADALADTLFNDLEPAVRPLAPIDALCERLLDAGALGAWMSGSGPTVFGLFANAGEAEAALRSIRIDPGEAAWSVTMLQSLPTVSDNPNRCES